jgi:parallel beta-helix repeat protein
MKRFIFLLIIMVLGMNLFSRSLLFLENHDIPANHDDLSTGGGLNLAINDRLFSNSPHTSDAWTEKPNGTTGPNVSDNYVSANFFAVATMLSGTYTIGGGGDFATFNDALSALISNGVSGPVVFNVANGTYIEQLNIPEITGASAVNTITFQSASGNYNDVVLRYSATGTADNFVVKLDGADYFRFRNMTLRSITTNYSKVVTTGNGATNNIFEGNRLLGVYTTTSFSYETAVVFIAFGYTSQDSVNTFNNNIIENGSFGMIWFGPSPFLERKTVITNNSFINQHYEGLQVYFQDAPLIESNTITTNSTYTSFKGIELSQSNNGIRVLKNKVNFSNGGTGLEINRCNGIIGDEGIIANNMISIGGSNVGNGLLISGCSNQRIYYNSVNVFWGSMNSRAFELLGTSTTPSLSITDNIFAYTGGGSAGIAVYVLDTGAIISMDNNDLYSNGTNLGYWNSTQQTLAAWQAVSSNDSNSVSVNPEFVSYGNLHTFSLNVFGLGKPVTQITDDIDGDPRDPMTPVIGADEFELPPFEAQLTNIVFPVNSCNHTSAEDVSITVKNIDAGPLTNIDAYYVLNNGTPVHEIIAGPIASLACYTYTFSAKADLSATGNYYFDFYINYPADTNQLNDSINNYSIYTGFDFLSGTYTQGFENTEYYADWSKFSVNSDSYTWEYPYYGGSHGGSVSARFYNGSTNANGDWLFSRCFPLLAGGNYEISYWYKGGSTSTASKLNLSYGLSATPAGMTSLLDSLPNILMTTYRHSESLFAAPTTDIYYFGWYAYTNPGTTNMYIDDINIRYYPSDNIVKLGIISPVDGCTLGSEAISVKIVNVGFDTIQNPFTIGYLVSGNPTAVTETVNYYVLPGDSVTHTFAVPALFNILSGDSTFQIKLFGTNTGDISFLNDTIVETVTLSFSPLGPTTSNDTITYGTSASLTANTPYHVYWYNQPVGGSLLGEGPVFSTPVLYGDATFYAEARDLHDTYVGPYDNTIGSGSFSNALYYMRFDVLDTQGIKINSVDVFPGVAAGAAYTIIVQNSSLQQIASYSAVTTVASGQRETIPVNFTIPFGTSYRILFSVMPNMARNSSGVSYPYTWANEISITGNNLSSNYYLYFYNWKVSNTYGCAGHRTPANIVVNGQPNNDAGIAAIIEPASQISLGIRNVRAILRNYGLNTLTSANIGWTVNGVAQSTYNWTGSLPTGASDTLVIGTYDFAYAPYPGLNDIVAWSYNPNSLADDNIINDTASVIIDAHDPYAGTYYIRTSIPDFGDFTEAVLALREWGVSAPVLILADTGTYEEQIVLPEIPGASDINIITFRSITGVNTDVVLQYAATGTDDNYVVKLDGADYLAFEELTMKSVTTSNYGRVVDLRSGANYNRFENNIIQSIVVTSSSYNITPICSPSNVASNYNRFIGNKILNGSYGVYFYGLSFNRKQGNHFDNNEISGWNNYGIYVSYCDSCMITNNLISTSSSATIYPIYQTSCDNGCIIEGNKIFTSGSGGSYGIYLLNNNLSTTIPNIIANNFLSSIGFAYGIYLSSSYYVNVYFNSVNIYGALQIGSSALYQTGGGNINIVNNNLVNTASGSAYTIATPAAIAVSDYNNLYTTGTVLAYWGTNQTTLALLQSASGKDVHSKSVMPEYYSPGDLHSYSFHLYRSGTPIAGITTDIDGEMRSSGNPCIGADEFQLKQIDAGITNIDGPNFPDSVGIFKIKVSLSNCGLDPLTSVTIKYMINGVQGTPYHWTGSLPSTATLANIIIDSAQFNYENYDITAWTELPNDTTDFLYSNDTSDYSFFNCPSPFKGIYTIGSTNCDFLNFDKAVDALNHCGIDSAVIFKVYPGTYYSNLFLDSIPGASNENTITFTSLSGNNNDVILSNPNNYNPTITLWNTASYYIFDKLTIECTLSVETIDLMSAHDIHFTNNVINKISTAFLYSYVIQGEVNNLLLENNDIIGGFYGVYLTYSDSVKIRNNDFTDFGYTGVYYSYGQNLLVSGNYFRKGNSACRYPNIEVHDCYDVNICIEKNIIDGYYSSDGILVNDCSGTSTTPILISNNFISLNNSSFSVGMAISSSYVNVYNNSIEIYGSNSMSNVAFQGGGVTINIFNNIFSNSAGGLAYASGNLDSSDFNNLFSSGTVLGEYNGTTFTDITGLQALSGNDGHSISVNPSFISNTDLHINNNPFLNAAATPIPGITTDIDGDIRDLVTPDIGADEFDYIVSIEEPSDQSGFILYQNQPNPASSSTSIYYNIPSSGEIVFEIQNNLGQVIVSKTVLGQSGLNMILSDVAGFRSGIYLYSVSFKGEKLTKRLSITY